VKRGVAIALILSCAAGLVAAARVQDDLTVATYNIRHGRGMDGEVDLARTARAIRALEADIVALQEVDRGVARSGSVHQPRELGERLEMQQAFGAFFPYQGGEYGMAILSRYPILRTEALRLPDGNEPRVALLAEVALPSGRRIAVVNVHFDWVADDSLRFRQVVALSAMLDTLALPIILLGDFNDVPGSRTMAQWSSRFVAVDKPANDHFTFSSTAPEKEIDHIVVAPRAAWETSFGRVVSDSVTSDHRAFVARLRLKAASGSR
jgi:endonuclease/exonuclease/phosphatase family metal-dependent hydrolase